MYSQEPRFLADQVERHSFNGQLLLGNRYRLLERLGSGGMGTVYSAFDPLTAQIVALKRVTAVAMQAAANTETRLALAHEFQALSSLHHPHIVAVRDYGFDSQQQPYFTMELLHRPRTIVAAGQIQTTTYKVDLLLQLLYALTYLHRRDVVHRDLKPGNVLVTGRDVKVLDFGLATLAGQPAETAGTLAYMAPETLRGEPVAATADLYAVGVIAYELFAGWHPFAQAPAGLVDAILGLEPEWSFVEIEPALRAVFQRLLVKAPAERYPDAPAVIAALGAATGKSLPVETQATRESFLQAAPFVGRQAELGQLSDALAQAMAGRGSAWLVAGESGVGKSRLLNELRTHALVGGVLVLRGQASSDGGGAYHLWRDGIRRLALLANLDDLEAAVLNPLAADLAALLGRPVAEAPPLEPQPAQTRLLTTVAGLVQRVAQKQPLLLLLEDLHWADDNSLELLQWLNRLVSRWPVLILGSYRHDEQSQLAGRLPQIRRLLLSRLLPDDIATLSAAMLGAGGRRPHLVAFLQQETEGNAFFVVEVVRALAEEAGRLERVADMTLPAHVFAGGMKQVVQRRLRRVAAVHRPLLRLAAVAGRQLDLAVLQAVDPENDLEAWLTAGAIAAVLEVQEGRWQFTHDKLREGVLAELEAGQRQVSHRQVAQAIERVYASHLPPHYADLAYHSGQAAEREQERHYLRLAAETAEATYANATAIEYYERLVPLLDTAVAQAEVLLKLGTVLKFIGRWQAAEERYRQALALAEPTQDEGLLASCLQALGALWRSRGDYQAALNWLMRARQGFEACADRAGLSNVLVEIGNVYYQQGEYSTARSHLEESLTLAQALGDRPGMALARHSLGSVAYSQADYARAQADYEESLALRQELGDRWGMANSFNNLGNVAYVQGEYETAQARYEKSLALRREVGDKWGMAASLNNLGIVPYHQGDFAAAQRFWEESLALRHDLGDKWGTAHSIDNLGLVAFAQGNYAAARARYAESLALRRETGDKQGLSITLSNLARVELDEGDYASAQLHYAESLALAQELDDKRGIIYGLLGLAGVAVRARPEQHQRAVRLAAAAQKLAEVVGIEMERDERLLFERTIAAARATLGEADFSAAWIKGQATTGEQAAAYALDRELRET